MTEEKTTDNWLSAWPDVLAFATWLAVAWWEGWTATDLVWGLWLSSLVVGYAMIVWSIVRPAMAVARAALDGRDMWSQLPGMATSTSAVVTTSSGTSTRRVISLSPVAGGVALGAFGLFMLAFFTIHFGGFHYVHSQFLIMFFPLDHFGAGHPGTANMETYLEIARRYWGVLPATFLAERAAFRRKPPEAQQDVSVTVAAIDARKAANARTLGTSSLTAPYRNVVRMHLLIFFFAFAQFLKLDGFAVYTVVYAAYFFPWRLVRRAPLESRAAALSDTPAKTTA
jgi:hypothetical protein